MEIDWNNHIPRDDPGLLGKVAKNNIFIIYLYNLLEEG